MSTPSSSSSSPSRKRLASEPEFWFSQLPSHLSFIFVPTLPADGPGLFLRSLPGLEINENSIPLPHPSTARRNRIASATLDAIEQDFCRFFLSLPRYLRDSGSSPLETPHAPTSEAVVRQYIYAVFHTLASYSSNLIVETDAPTAVPTGLNDDESSSSDQDDSETSAYSLMPPYSPTLLAEHDESEILSDSLRSPGLSSEQPSTSSVILTPPPSSARSIARLFLQPEERICGIKGRDARSDIKVDFLVREAKRDGFPLLYGEAKCPSELRTRGSILQLLSYMLSRSKDGKNFEARNQQKRQRTQASTPTPSERNEASLRPLHLWGFISDGFIYCFYQLYEVTLKNATGLILMMEEEIVPFTSDCIPHHSRQLIVLLCHIIGHSLFSREAHSRIQEELNHRLEHRTPSALSVLLEEEKVRAHEEKARADEANRIAHVEKARADQLERELTLLRSSKSE